MGGNGEIDDALSNKYICILLRPPYDGFCRLHSFTEHICPSERSAQVQLEYYSNNNQCTICHDTVVYCAYSPSLR
jgi:hypothetical protein